MRAGDLAGEVSDGCDQCRPDLSRLVGVRPVIAARVKTQCTGLVQSRNAAFAQVRLCDGAPDRLRHSEQAARGFGRTGRCRRLFPSLATGRRLGPRQAEKPPGLMDDIVEVDEAAALSDNVEQIAVLAGRCVHPFAGGAFAEYRSLQAHEHGSS
jgi:hypothetical protein